MNKLRCEKTEVFGIESALRGMRNPMDSWHLQDTRVLGSELADCDTIEEIISLCEEQDIHHELLEVGEKDMDLACRLIKAGNEHCKFLRQIQVWTDITTTRYVWSELDTYKFGTKNSCSTMHTIMRNPLTLDNFYLGEELEDIIKTKPKSIGTIIPIKLPKGVKEEWCDINGFEGRYKISNKGEIIRYACVDVYEDRVVNRKEKVIKPSVNDQGYLKVGLNKDGKYYNKTVHRLIAEHFIPNTENKPYVNHIDGNKLNNNLANLEWVTASENTKHAHDNKIASISEYTKWKTSNASRRFTHKDVTEIKNMYGFGYTIKEISTKYDCCDSVISNIIKGKTYVNIFNYELLDTFEDIINNLNTVRARYVETKDYEYVRIMKRILPESFLQKRTWNTNYAELINIYFQRKNHRLTNEWKAICDWILTLPYMKEFIEAIESRRG